MTNNTVISFSGGKTSGYMTIELLKNPLYKDAVIAFMNTGKEKEQTLDFVNQVDLYLQENFNKKIIWLEYLPTKPLYKVVTYETASRNGEPFKALILRRKYVPNIVMRFCTQELKILLLNRYLKRVLGWKTWDNLVGIRYDEEARYNKVKNFKKVYNTLYPLVTDKVVKKDILAYWENMPFTLNLKEGQGNCDLCFLKGKQLKQRILSEEPKIADWWIEMEKIANGTFSKEYSIEYLRKFLLSRSTFDTDDTIQCFCTEDL